MHELANGGDDGGDGFIVGSELVIDLELSEPARQFLEATKRAAEILAKRGVIEIRPETGLYRLKPRVATK